MRYQGPLESMQSAETGPGRKAATTADKPSPDQLLNYIRGGVSAMYVTQARHPATRTRGCAGAGCWNDVMVN
ncbi:hypothetical protein MESS2_30002 [Mesorhizobium metallidurans STM 2683]|uniref:Uncharacterized protein n=1 Tax=Mesorhizobium metallidurans STM 2683 TaxID=1297569 RepID=M5F303_9HYPH|nr:hypothetical protein MESS2_30002 [Mesorhizobium metallidurans STM 2683]